MNHPDSDLLRKAATALRTERTGHNPGSGFTRARILNDVRLQRKKRSRWWRLGFPFGIILAGTTAWASASGKWPEVWVNVSTLLNLPLTDNGASERSLATVKTSSMPRSKPSATDADPLAMAPGGNTANDGVGEEPVAPPAAEPSLGNTPPEPATVAAGSGETSGAPQNVNGVASVASGPGLPVARRAGPASSPRSRALRGALDTAPPTPDLPPPPPAAPPELEAEIHSFRRADDLYRRSGDTSAAIAAYRQYVRDYPTGRFVPEAKYNMALALVKLGRVSEARPLLLPFAEGAYGSYRKAAAQKLLEALD